MPQTITKNIAIHSKTFSTKIKKARSIGRRQRRNEKTTGQENGEDIPYVDIQRKTMSEKRKTKEKSNIH